MALKYDEFPLDEQRRLKGTLPAPWWARTLERAMDTVDPDRRAFAFIREVLTQRYRDLIAHVPGLTPARLKTIRDAADIGNLIDIQNLYEDMAEDPDIADGISSYRERIRGTESQLLQPAGVEIPENVMSFVQAETVDRMDWPEILGAILNAVPNGIEINECNWTNVERDGLIRTILNPKQPLVRKTAKYAYWKNGVELTWRGDSGDYPQSEWPDRRVLVALFKSPGPQPGRYGLLRLLMVTYMMKTMTRNDWTSFNGRFGKPFIQGTGREGMTKEQLQKMAENLAKFAGDGSGATEFGTEIALLQANMQSVDTFERFYNLNLKQIQIVFKGNATTTQNYEVGTRATAQVGADASKEDRWKPGCRWTESYVNLYIRWLVDLNYGTGVPCPYLWFTTESKAMAPGYERLAIFRDMVGMGVPISVDTARQDFVIDMPAEGAQLLKPVLGPALGGIPGAFPGVGQSADEAAWLKYLRESTGKPAPQNPFALIPQNTGDKAAKVTASPDELTEEEFKSTYPELIEANPRVPWKAVADRTAIESLSEQITSQVQPLYEERIGEVTQGVSLEAARDSIEKKESFEWRREYAGYLFKAYKTALNRAKRHVDYYVERIGKRVKWSGWYGCLKMPALGPSASKFTPVAALDYWQVASFYVAHVEEAAVLASAKALITEALRRGYTYEEFRRGLSTIMRDAGLPVLAEGHIQTVYATNMATAYNAGRYSEMDAVADILPNWSYWAVNGGTAEICIELFGQVYPASDPIWNEFYPPNHFNCTGVCIPESADTAQSEGKPSVSPGEGFGGLPGSGVDNWAEEQGWPWVKARRPVFVSGVPRPEQVKAQKADIEGVDGFPVRGLGDNAEARRLLTEAQEVKGWLFKTHVAKAYIKGNKAVITVDGLYDSITSDMASLADGVPVWRPE